MSQSPANSMGSDFADQLEILAAQAERRLDERPKHDATENFAEWLRPLVLGIEALSRATMQNTQALERLEQAAATQAAQPDLKTTVQEALHQKNSVTQKLFDAMHEELRTYKDGFLLEVFHRPIVRDLITLYDDLSGLERQTDAFLAHLAMRNDLNEKDILVVEQMRIMSVNLSHGLHSLVETMARMEVTRMPLHTGKLNRQSQRAVSVEITNEPDEDGMIVRSVKPGFQWRDRLVRPEEVVTKKWKKSTHADYQM